MVALTGDELTEMRMKVQSGELPPDAIKRYLEDERKNVFGFDHKMKNGKPVEQGIGSPGNQTANSVAAFEKYHSHSPTYERDLAVLKKQLAESEARRATQQQEVT